MFCKHCGVPMTKVYRFCGDNAYKLYVCDKCHRESRPTFLNYDEEITAQKRRRNYKKKKPNNGNVKKNNGGK